jgi:predicted DsbA family dithiol-disulfide isomerase
VTRDVERARALGINGVPLYLFEEKWAVSGAQPTEVFGEALREVAGRLTA